MCLIKHDKISPMAANNGTEGLAERLRATGKRRPIQCTPRRGLILRGKAIAGLHGEALAVFELPQFPGRIERDIRIGADAPSSRCVPVRNTREYTIAQIR